MHRPLTVLVAAGLLGAAAPATTFRRETTADLVRRAERVCSVLCESIEPRRDPRSGFVFTHVRLRVLEELKGRVASATIELRIPGGRVGGVETIVAGMPRFKPGTESVVLLGARNREGYRVLLQGRGGVLPLLKDRRGRRCVAARVTGMAELKGRRVVTIDDFRASVKRVLRKRPESRK